MKEISFEEEDVRKILEEFAEYLQQEFYDDDIYRAIVLKPGDLHCAIDDFIESIVL